MTKDPADRSSPYRAQHARRALGHFIGGRLGGSLLGFIATLLVARELPTAAYGAYAVLLGFTTFVGTGSSFSLDQAAQRFLPELVVTRQGASLRRLLWWLVAGRLAFLGVSVLAFLLALPWLATRFALGDWLPEARIWAGTIAAVVAVRYLCTLLEVFLLQRHVKWIVLAIAALRLSLLLAWIWWAKSLSLAAVAAIELAANGLMIPPALVFLRRGTARYSADTSDGAQSGTLVQRLRAYLTYGALREWVIILAGPATNRLVMGSFARLVNLGTYGFAQTIVDFVQRYLPSMLLRNMIWPVAMAKFAERRSYEQIEVIANVTLKLNVALLTPFCVAVTLVGAPLVSVLTNGKYPQSAAYIVGFVGLFLIQSHYFLLETYANASEEQQPLFLGSVIAATSIVPALYLVPRFGVWGLVGSRAAGILVRDIVVSIVLKGRGVPCQWDLWGTAKLLLAGGVSWVGLHHYAGGTHTLLGYVLVGAAAVFIFVLAALLLRPFRPSERQLLNGALGRRLVF